MASRILVADDDRAIRESVERALGLEGYDTLRIAAWGESAGCNLVALLGTTGDQATIFDDEAGVSRVAAGSRTITPLGGGALSRLVVNLPGA